ncbi:MAG: THUMP-like domain-containing protein [Sphingobacteriaceae bacterium]
MNSAILDHQVQQYIQENLNTDMAKLVFKKSPFAGISTKELAEQIAGKKAAEKKLPAWFNTPGIYFPPKIAIEQSSSAQTALYKSKIVPAQLVIDLTGGMGVDSLYFAKQAKQLVHVEQQSELSAIAAHNSKILGVDNIEFISATAENYLKTTKNTWDLIYLDPSRRIASQKVFKLSDCEPNIVALQSELLQRSPYVLVKTAPLLDIRSGLSELHKVREIQVISLNNEMKELLWLLDASFEGSEPNIKCISLTATGEKSFSFKLSIEKALQLPSYSAVQQFLYEPDAAWLKAGCFKLITQQYQLGKLHQHTHLYTSDNLKSEFPGKQFKVINVWPYKEFIQQNHINKANVISRNFPLTVEELKKKHAIKDGGDIYLFFCTNHRNELSVIQAERI